MNTRRYSLLLMSLAMAFAMFATPLTPSQALSLAMQKSVGPMRAQAQQMTLVKTCTAVNNQTPALYVFSSASDKPGFMVLAADDYARRIVMGYSDTDSFDPNNIPPSMQWWLDAASASVMADAQQGPSAKEQSAAPRRAERRTIEPLVTTKWGQDEPYNNMCPILEGNRAVTGCVATAMAQIMKYHQYPTNGTGSFSYTFMYNVKEYTASADFGNTTYDWNYMCNYYNSASEKEKDAVATLMYHCGVASKMGYSPYASGAYGIDAAQGAISYFDYDKSLQYLLRAWYTADEWDELVYEMLDAGLPMMYTGNDGSVGHAFVCDGIDAYGYYHINWGWEGFANGYFELSDLNPLIQGIGGGDGEVGYNFNQSILYNLKPNAGGSGVPSFALEGDFDAEQILYPRNDDTKVTFTAGNGFFSYTPTVLQNVTFGVYCKGDEIDQFVTCITHESAEPGKGAKIMRAFTTDFPVGSYDVYPAFKDANGTMYLMHTIVGASNCLTFNVFSSKIIINTKEYDGDSNNANSKLYTSLKSWSRHNSSDDEIYAGNTYDFTFDLTATGQFNDKLRVVLIDNTGKIKSYGSYLPVYFEQAGTRQQAFNLDIPSNLQDGSYSICLGKDKNNRLDIVGSVSDIDIHAELRPSGSATISNISLNHVSLASSSKANPGVTTSDKQTIEVTMKCTKAPFVDYLLLGFFDPDTEKDVAWMLEGSMLHIKNVNDTNTLIFEGPWFGLRYDTTYGMAVFNDADDQLSDMYYIRISSESGVATIWADDDAEPQYYNMQGVRVSNPGPGIYIRRQGNKVTKEAIK